MDESKLTPWFVNGETPELPGVYNVSCRKERQTGDWFAKWDGKRWYYATWRYEQQCYKKAEREKQEARPWHENGSWRGLAEKPE